MKYKPAFEASKPFVTALSNARFTKPLPANLAERTAFLASWTVVPRNIGTIPATAKRLKQFVVRVFLNGRSLTSAILPNENVEEALRIADMATVYFWKYRLRGGEEPGSDRLNYNLAQAKSDLSAETDIRDLLLELELVWQSEGVLPTAAELLARKKKADAPKVTTSLRKLVEAQTDAGKLTRERLEELITTLRDREKGITDALGFLQHQHGSFDTQIGQQQMQLANLVAQFQRIADNLTLLAKAQQQILVKVTQTPIGVSAFPVA